VLDRSSDFGKLARHLAKCGYVVLLIWCLLNSRRDFVTLVGQVLKVALCCFVIFAAPGGRATVDFKARRTDSRKACRSIQPNVRSFVASRESIFDLVGFLLCAAAKACGRG
jgi:hypothetical protein